MDVTKEYTNGEVTIVWKPKKCIHSGNCVRGLPDVFMPKEKPWIKIDNADSESLIKQVQECPSGALSYYLNSGEDKTTAKNVSLETKVEVLENGPLLVYGTIHITHRDGSTEKKNKTTAFCRCGYSGNKPYCDGSHTDANFNG